MSGSFNIYFFYYILVKWHISPHVYVYVQEYEYSCYIHCMYYCFPFITHVYRIPMIFSSRCIFSCSSSKLGDGCSPSPPVPSGKYRVKFFKTSLYFLRNLVILSLPYFCLASVLQVVLQYKLWLLLGMYVVLHHLHFLDL